MVERAQATQPQTRERRGVKGLFSGRYRWATIGALIAILAAVAVVVASGAIFSSETANPDNTFTAGVLSQSNSANGAAILTATGMVPGAPPKTGDVTIKNTGDVAGTFTLRPGTPTDTAGPNGGKLSAVLNLKVVETGAGGATEYDGPLADMPNKPLGKWAPDESHTYRFTVRFPDAGQPGTATGGDNAYQGSSTKVTYTWTAVTD